jgi:MAF protein
MSSPHPSPPLYLASASPRRRQLLAQAGIAYEVVVVPIDEDALAADYRGPLEHLGEHLAAHKACAARAALRARGQHGAILASDTTVLLEGTSLAKPRDGGEARGMLTALRGREHLVATGVALGSTATDALTTATSVTRVLMRAYSEEEIDAYVASGDPFDKAGGYSIQHPGFQPVAQLSGCHLGVIGLPVCIVAALVGDAALPPAREDKACPWSPLCTRPYPGPEAICRAAMQGDAP